MELNFATAFLAMTAGLASVASPCVLPVVPIIVTGREQDSAYRPLLIVLGLSLMFILMGVISALFGHLLAGSMGLLEKITGAIILLFGILMLLDINPFKRLKLISDSASNTNKGRLEGLILGLTLGLIWIPCVGPMLSSVLGMVATTGQVSAGIVLLTIYSLGFAIPMLLAAYTSHFFRNQLRSVQRHASWLKWVNGGILILFGGYILAFGLINFGY